MFRMSSNFKGTFPLDFQERCVPDSLKALVDTILEGPSIKKKRCRGDALKNGLYYYRTAPSVQQHQTF